MWMLFAKYASINTNNHKNGISFQHVYKHLQNQKLCLIIMMSPLNHIVLQRLKFSLIIDEVNVFLLAQKQVMGLRWMHWRTYQVVILVLLYTNVQMCFLMKFLEVKLQIFVFTQCSMSSIWSLMSLVVFKITLFLFHLCLYFMIVQNIRFNPFWPLWLCATNNISCGLVGLNTPSAWTWEPTKNHAYTTTIAEDFYQ